MVLTSSDARCFSSVVFPALSSPNRTMRSSCSGESFSLWMTESSPCGHRVLEEPCKVLLGGYRAPSFQRGELGTLLAIGTLCLWPECVSGLGSQGVQAQGDPTADPPSPNPPPWVCCPCPGSPASSCRDKPRVYSPGSALPGGLTPQQEVLAHPPPHRQDGTRPHIPSAHQPWSESCSGPQHTWGAAGGSSPGPAGGCVTGTHPIAGGGRGLRAPELAAVSPFTHSIK